MKRWTDVERRRLGAARADRQSVRDIAGAHHRSESAVRTALSWLAPGRVPAPPAPTIQPPATLLDAFLRKPSGTALPKLIERRRPITARPGRRMPRTHWTDEQHAVIQTMIEAGRTNEEIAGQLSCTTTTLTAWLHKHKIRRTKAAMKKLRSGPGPAITAPT